MTTIHGRIEQERTETQRRMNGFIVIPPSVPKCRIELVLASQRDAMKIARHFSAVHYPQSLGSELVRTSRFALPLSQNPNGIPSHSPGLRASRYPGKRPHRMINPNGVVYSSFLPTSNLCLSLDLFFSMFCNNARRSSGHNPVGVAMFIRSFPRVARCAQPWAMGRNPVGILKRQDLCTQFRPPNFVGNEQHFSAGGNRVSDIHSPVGTAETLEVSDVPTGLRKTRACPCPGTKVPGYYQAAPAGARTAFAPCHAKLSRAFPSRTIHPSDRCR
jgi:hypothetical protein